MATYFYMRISTQEDRGIQKFSRQESALRKYAEDNKLQFDEHNIYQEDRSGKNFEDRQEWNNLEKNLHPGDTIVFKDISRFTREAENGYQKYMKLYNDGIRLVFLDNQTICTDYIRKLLDTASEQPLIAKITLENTVKLLLYVELDRVEQERITLQNRIKDGIAASEKRSGRPKGKLDKLTPELEADILLYLKDRTILQITLQKKHRISHNTLKKYIELIRKGLSNGKEEEA